ncbi:hypothetical protein DOTSEDRAFT_69567 [Dothistroma septosporum NZE10]|uniref:Methyltransferase domain-containing protein n=1 Tax=Dothistroma septosporum (strain NZE10 / CBS 128990) TaxID=675120 RepID=N1PZ61_DOTSN|nr:hypothetical protein DOTSEDRAFT_69567 [Dothistroma septosporum NZE10]
MTSSTFKDIYSLPRDNIESARLENQHRQIIKNTGFVLHPRIVLPENAHIADVATGTGIWMKDVAATAPSTCSFTGFDLSDAQFPPANERDGRAFKLLNILRPVPEQLQGTFDVVHTRYLICALTSKDWPIVAQNLLKLLKPGGYLQWFESDFPQMSAIQSDPQVGREATSAMLNAFMALQRDHDVANIDAVDPGLRQSVEEAGYEDIREDVIASDHAAETRKDHSIVGLQAVTGGTLLEIKKRGSWMHDEKWVDDMYHKALEEAEGGTYIRWDMHVVTARKPA